MTFTRRVNNASQFIPVELRSKWEEFRHQWCFIRFPHADDSLDAPSEAPRKSPSWDSHIVLDFLRCAVAPLQERSHPMWEYQGPQDKTRLREAYFLE